LPGQSEKQVPHPAKSAGIRDDTLWRRALGLTWGKKRLADLKIGHYTGKKNQEKKRHG
jgi:hypothetical protein